MSSNSLRMDFSSNYVAPSAKKSVKSDFKAQESARNTAKNIRFAAFVMVAAVVCYIGYKVISSLPM